MGRQAGWQRLTAAKGASNVAPMAAWNGPLIAGIAEVPEGPPADPLAGSLMLPWPEPDENAIAFEGNDCLN